MYNMEITFRVEILILIAILFFVMWGHVFCSCSRIGVKEAFDETTDFFEKLKLKTKKPKKEGFGNMSMLNDGESSAYDTPPVNTSTWFQPKGSSAESILQRPTQPVPLPEGEMVMFATTEFKPECCSSSYSTGSGCACMTVPQYNYLVNRGGNNVPYSEY
jgi:hypothetical protein